MKRTNTLSASKTLALAREYGEVYGVCSVQSTRSIEYTSCRRDDICAVCKVGPDSGNITVRDPNAHGASCGDDSDKGVSEGQARRIGELKEVEVASAQHGRGRCDPVVATDVLVTCGAPGSAKAKT